MDFSPPQARSSDLPPEFAKAVNSAADGNIAITVVSVIGIIAIVVAIIYCIKKNPSMNCPSVNMSSTKNIQPSSQVSQPFIVIPDSQIKLATVEHFLNDIAREKPIRFTPEQLEGFTHNYTTKLGSGGFGVVYKGELSNGVLVATKVLNGNMGKRVEEQFMAEVATIGRTYHVNLVRLYGFCFDRRVTALVYEYLENGSLDKYLFNKNIRIEWKKLKDIAIGTAKGLRYLHEECKDKILHYDIKPANILLDEDFSPKVADFGLAKLSNRENTHVSMDGPIGTPGYAAPEMWSARRVTEKCDVYSFGILLFEIVGKKKQFDSNLTESLQWFPRWVWQKFEAGQMRDVESTCGIKEEDREDAERMCKVAFHCIQYQPEARPPMSKVVRMLEGEMEINSPTDPFQHSNYAGDWSLTGTEISSTTEATSEHPPRKKNCTPIMKKYEIEIAASS